MTKHLVEVNYAQHKNYALLAKCSEHIAKGLNIVPVTFNELRHLAKYSPLALVKHNGTGEYKLVAVFGFEQGENLYCQNHLWDETYCPMHLSIKPFYLGYSYQGQDKRQAERVLCVDQNNPLVVKNDKQGINAQAFYRAPHQENTCLLRARESLVRLEQGQKLTHDFIQSLSQLNLIQSLTLDITWDNGEKASIAGLYTVDPQQLETLSTVQLQQLQQHNYFEAITVLNQSLNHIQKLITLKNKQLTLA
jgi:hypothetical protein